jgi:hypothetical protein
VAASAMGSTCPAPWQPASTPKTLEAGTMTVRDGRSHCGHRWGLVYRRQAQSLFFWGRPACWYHGKDRMAAWHVSLKHLCASYRGGDTAVMPGSSLARAWP